MQQKFKRSIDEIRSIVAMTETFFRQQNMESDLRYVVDLAIEELFVNMVTYNIESDQDILLQMSPHKHGIEVSLTDFDVDRFDPTRAVPIKVDVPLVERTSGGLGLYLVLKMVDSIHYEYRNRQSKITFVIDRK